MVWPLSTIPACSLKVPIALWAQISILSKAEPTVRVGGSWGERMGDHKVERVIQTAAGWMSLLQNRTERKQDRRQRRRSRPG